MFTLPAPILSRFTFGLLIAAGLSLSGPGPTSAQSAAGTEAWFGVPQPTGLDVPPQFSVLERDDFTAPAAPVPPGEEGDAELAGVRIQRWLRDIVGFSAQSRAKGALMWGRVSGFPAAAATADWVAQRFRDAGLSQVEIQRYGADQAMWWPEHWEVRLLGGPGFGEGSGDVILGSAVPTGGSAIPGRTLTADLIYAGDVGDLRAVDVAGKVAVQRRRPTSGAASQRGAILESARELFQRGAVAVLNYIDQPGNMHVRDFSGCGEVCFNIGGADGGFLRSVTERAAEAGSVDNLRVRLYLDADTRSGLTAQNVVGIVPGDSDEIVIVNAHLDGWFGAATDNGDGLAVQIALARHFARPENRLARTLVFVASGGHHSTGLNGPQNFVRMNPDLTGRAVLVLNLEHVAQYAFEVDPGRFRRTEQAMQSFITNLAPFLIDLKESGMERYGFRLRPTSPSAPGDLVRYEPLGVPRVGSVHAGPLYHTTGDVFETISVEGLERAARFYAFFIEGVANAPRGEIDP